MGRISKILVVTKTLIGRMKDRLVCTDVDCNRQFIEGDRVWRTGGKRVYYFCEDHYYATPRGK